MRVIRKHMRFFVMLVFFCVSCVDPEKELVLDNEIIDLMVLSSETGEILESEVGDGDKKVVLRARIPENADNKFRNVTFTATEGTFVQAQNSTHNKRVSDEGIADVEFQLPLSNNEIFFTAGIGSGEDIFKAENSLKLIGVGQVITLAVLDVEKQELHGNVRADGNTILTLAATVNFNQDNFNQITFENSGGGSFLGVNAAEAKVNIDENNVAFLQYQIPNTVGRIFFETSVGGNDAIFNTANLDLIRSYPDSIVVEPATSSVVLNNSVSIGAYLLKSLGKVSQGTAPKFEAFQLADNGDRIEVGRFIGIPEALTDSNGKVTVSFFADSPNIDETKPITIMVSSLDDSENTISEQIEIQITQ